MWGQRLVGVCGCGVLEKQSRFGIGRVAKQEKVSTVTTTQKNRWRVVDCGY